MDNWRRIGLALVCSLALLSGCCNSPKEYHYDLTPSTLELVPYHLNSTFRMENSVGQIESFSVLDERREEMDGNTCASCCTQEFEDHYFLILKGETTPNQFKIELMQTGQEGTAAAPEIRISINSNGIFYASLQPEGMCGNDPFLICHDSITVAGRVFSEVYELKNHGSSEQSDTPKELYYNASHGFLKINTIDGSTWELIQ